jgi:hypothetical protein
MADKTNHPPYVQTNVVFRYKLEKCIDSTNLLKTKKYENSKIPVEIKKGDPDMWTLFFDGSKSLEGAVAGCILKGRKFTKMLISC